MSVIIGTVPTFADATADKAQALKVMEEAAEVYGAWQDFDQYMEGTLSWQAARYGIIEECADVIQATCNMLAALGVTDIGGTMAACRGKNRDRGRVYAE